MQIRPPLKHSALIEDLWRAAAAGRLGHALLFEGPEGIGKFVAAAWFAQGLLCERGPMQEPGARPCGACRGCKKLLSGGPFGNHPDCLLIDRAAELEAGADGGPAISVGHIAARGDGERREARSVEEFLGLKASEGGYRVVLLREAERMGEAAQNALLKTLEEPALGTFLVLECSAPQALLTTLRSRTLRARFEPLDDAELKDFLASAEELDPAESTRWIAFAEGSPGRLMQFLARGGPEIAEQWWRVLNPGPKEPQSLRLDALLAGAEDEEGGTALMRRRARVGLCLEVLAALLEELWLECQGLEPLGGGLLRALDPAGQRNPERSRLQLERQIAGLGECLSDLASNVDPEACLERAVSLLLWPRAPQAAGGRPK